MRQSRWTPRCSRCLLQRRGQLKSLRFATPALIIIPIFVFSLYRIIDSSIEADSPANTLTLAPSRTTAELGTLVLTPFPMEDSPLSITANIAGILTFVAAILASIYVRIVSLRNGRTEMERIRKSSEENVVDLGLLSTETRFESLRESQEHLAFHDGDEPNVVRWKDLSRSLIITDMIIYTYCMRAIHGDAATDHEIFLLNSIQSMIEATFHQSHARIPDTHQFVKTVEEVRDLVMEWNRPTLIEKVVTSLTGKTVLLASRMILTAGSSPTLIRWYQMREIVLEKVRQRGMLRSRILSLQISLASS